MFSSVCIDDGDCIDDMILIVAVILMRSMMFLSCIGRSGSMTPAAAGRSYRASIVVCIGVRCGCSTVSRHRFRSVAAEDVWRGKVRWVRATVGAGLHREWAAQHDAQVMCIVMCMLSPLRCVSADWVLSLCGLFCCILWTLVPSAA